MTCDTCRAQLNAYYDNELDAVERIAVEGHLHECLGCRDALADIAAVSALVQEAMPLPEVDDAFTAAVMAQIEQLEAKQDTVLPAGAVTICGSAFYAQYRADGDGRRGSSLLITDCDTCRQYCDRCSWRVTGISGQSVIGGSNTQSWLGPHMVGYGTCRCIWNSIYEKS